MADDIITVLSNAIAKTINDQPSLGLTAYPAYPDSLTLSIPALVIMPTEGEYHGTATFEDEVYFNLVLVAALVSVGHNTGQATLNRYIDRKGAYGLGNVLEQSSTLAQYADDVTMLSWSDYSMEYRITPNGPDHFGVTFRLRIYPKLILPDEEP